MRDEVDSKDGIEHSGEGTEALVLVADDDAIVRTMAEKSLGECGFKVLTAKDGEEALTLCSEASPDVVLLDIQMPKLDGIGACAKLRSMPCGRTLPILIITCRDDTSSIDLAYAAGATDFTSKPLNWPLLCHRVRYLLQANKAIHDARTAEGKISQLAYYDPLTNRPNREGFKEHLEHALSVAWRQSWRVAIVSIGLDDLSRVIDTLGYSMGDQLLAITAERLTGCVRNSDYIGCNWLTGDTLGVARLASDEFAVALTIIKDVKSIAGVVERIAFTLSRPVTLSGQEVFVTSGIGVAIFPEDGQYVDTLLRNASTAMHHAKRAGKNGFRFYDQSMNTHARKRLNMEGKLHKALDNGELSLHYQPLVEFRDNRLVGMEALLRWSNPELGDVPPSNFVPMAEETGAIGMIGQWALCAASAQSVCWEKGGYPPLKLAVNLSPCQFHRSGLIPLLEEVLESTGLPPERLDLELTENLLMQNKEESISMLKVLRDMGISLSVDDFGTGYSSLNYLKRFPIQTLKIDRSFIKGLPSDLDDVGIASAIIAMAHSLKMRVVAEGVESEEQRAFLQNEGCDAYQGYLFSRPLPVEGITRLMDSYDAQGVRLTS